MLDFGCGAASFGYSINMCHTGTSSFLPSNRPRIDGDVTYGDTSMSIPYIAANFPCWQVVSEHCHPIEPYQVLLFLRPA